MITLGINWKWHDPAAALVEDGVVLAMAEEERFSRRKHARNSYPRNAVQFCLKAAGIDWRELDVIAIGWNVPALTEWTSDSRRELVSALFGEEFSEASLPIEFVGHHEAHMASAFYASGFESAGVLVIDGAGEHQSASIYRASKKGRTELLREWSTSYSIGAMYEAATTTLGFGLLDCGKTMGLAPYSVSRHSEVLPLGGLLPSDVELGPPFQTGKEVDYVDLLQQWEKYLGRVFSPISPDVERLSEDKIATALAASAQRTVEEAYRQLYSEVVCLSGEQNLCVAGGVALNSVANGRLPEPVFIPPWPHDAGVAIGAAWTVSPPPEDAPPQHSAYLGYDIDDVPSRAELERGGMEVTDFHPSEVVTLLEHGKVGAIASGRAEVGPRALGHRSIIAIPRPAEMRSTINTLKGREQWRPLAPVTLPDYADTLWARQPARERYMVGNTTVSQHGRSVLPAATHVDGSTRPQVVDEVSAPILASLLSELGTRGAPPVLINTSFNGPGEPIVNSLQDALGCFQRCSLDFMIVNDSLVTRKLAR